MTQDLNQQLRAAVREGQVDESRRLLEAGATCEPLPGQEPLLHLAVARDNADMIAVLLAHGADPDLEQPLCHALDQRRSEAAIALIEGGADVKAPVNVRRIIVKPIRYGYTTITSTLVYALFKRMPEAALALIEHGADLHDPDVLPMSAYQGHTAVVEALLARGLRNPEALYPAAKCKHKECLRLLVAAHGVDLEWRQREWSLLHMAAYSGCPDLIEQWFEAGGAVDVRDRSRNAPLLLALWEKNYVCAQRLTAHGVDVRANGTAFRVAADAGVLDQLPDRPVTESADPCAQLRVAVQVGNVEIATQLLEGGLVCPPEAGQLSLLHLAAKFDNAPLTRLLLKHGYDPDYGANVGNVGGYTPLHLAAEHARPAVVNALLRHGADIEAQTTYRHTPLRSAAAASNLGAARALLNAGARSSADYVDVLLSVDGYHGRTFTNVSPQDFDNRPHYHQIVALLIAHIQDPQERARSERRYQEHLAMRLEWAITGHDKRKNVLRSVLARGADPNVSIGHQRRPLHIAAESCNAGAVTLLLAHGADVNVSTSFGYTPLHYAACCETPHLVELLLEAGADPAAQIGGGSRLAGWTPLHFAHSHQNARAIRLLEPVSPPLPGPVEPGSHGFAGTYIDVSSPGSAPLKVAGPVRGTRCLVCGEYALYCVGAEWDGTNLLHAECTRYFRCGNCNAKATSDERGFRPYKGSLHRWRKVESEN